MFDPDQVTEYKTKRSKQKEALLHNNAQICVVFVRSKWNELLEAHNEQDLLIKMQTLLLSDGIKIWVYHLSRLCCAKPYLLLQ